MEKKKTSRVAPSPWLEVVERFQKCIEAVQKRWQQTYRSRMREHAHLDTEFCASMESLLQAVQARWKEISSITLGRWTACEQQFQHTYEEDLQRALTQRHVALERVDDLLRRLSTIPETATLQERVQTFRQLYQMLIDLQERLQRMQSFRNAYKQVLQLRHTIS